MSSKLESAVQHSGGSSRVCPDCQGLLEIVDKTPARDRDKRLKHFVVTYEGRCVEHGLFKWHESFEQVGVKSRVGFGA